MGNYITQTGVMPILIPDLPDEHLFPFLEEMDGFVFQGGNDIAPSSYNAEPIGRWLGDPYRDQYELKIMDFAIKQDKPIFAICRGFQLLNVYFGGTLLQDIPSQRPDAIQHRCATRYDQMAHEIDIVSGTVLAELYHDSYTRMVNTIHHQGIDELGKNLEVMAYCKEDRIIEAIMWTGTERGKVIGVQWHPEFFYNHQSNGLLDEYKLLNYFLNFCKKSS